jgi:arylsulfatase A-like enzyme
MLHPLRILAAAMILALLPIAGRSAERKPNFILLIADDMACDDCGAYGHPTIRTPQLDRLAREGMRLERAFLTCSSCSPSRASIITGRYPHNTGAEQLHVPLPKEQITFVELLRKAGYWTAAAGKWHLGDAVKDRFDLVGEEQFDGGKNSGCERWVALLQQRPKDKPFFLWLASFHPHRPYLENAIPQPHDPKDVVVPPYLPDVPETHKELALYYDAISRLDGYVGQVRAELARQGILENTCILFLSDNGRPFPRCKTTVYDSGIKTPFLVRWPERVKAGTVCRSLVSSVDIAPTLLELAGLKPGPTFQGKSFARLLQDPTAHVREYVYAEHNKHNFDAHERAVRSERFGYIRNYYNDLPQTPPVDIIWGSTFQAMRRLRDLGKLTPAQRSVFVQPRPLEELYDTAADPHELHNLAGDPRYENVLNTLRWALKDWQRTTNDIMPKERSPDDPYDRETGKRLPLPRPLPAPGTGVKKP